MVDEATLKTVRNYVAAVRANGIAVDSAVVFGSYARGEATAESDIDLLLISQVFDSPRDRAITSILWRLRAITDSRIEPVAAGRFQWQNDAGDPLLSMARAEGIEIPLD